MTNPRSSEPLTLTAREASRGFSEAIAQVHYCGRRVNVTRRGQVVAVIVPPEEVQPRQGPAHEGTRGQR